MSELEAIEEFFTFVASNGSILQHKLSTSGKVTSKTADTSLVNSTVRAMM